MQRRSVGGHRPVVFRRARLLSVLLMISLIASACVAAADPTSVAGGDQDTVDLETEVGRTTIVPTMRPTSAEDLGIALDRQGRPYDNYWGPEGATAEVRPAKTLMIDRGRLEIVDGNLVINGGAITVRETKSVDFRGVEELDLRIIWKKQPVADAEDSEADSQIDSDSGDTDTGDGPDTGTGTDTDEDTDDTDEDTDEPAFTESILGAIVAVPEKTVVRWGEFQRAYDTKTGLGAITSRSILEWSVANLDPETALADLDAMRGRPFAILDIDDDDLDDLFLFDNGTDGADGTYVLSRGFDEDDIMVAIAVWHGGFPWRLAVLEGDPPPDITQREEELIDCIEGRRLIDKWGRCT